jgi:hypothetical protein
MRCLSALTILAVMAVTPAMAATKAEKANCEANALIVQQVVELRQAKTRKAKALASLIEGENAVEERMVPVATGIVDWVYGLKRKELKLDPAASFKEACLSY